MFKNYIQQNDSLGCNKLTVKHFSNFKDIYNE